MAKMTVNKIINGDCFELFKQMEDKSVDYVFTSPPYNRKRNDKYKLYNDTLVDYYGFLFNVVEQSRRVSRNHVFLNIQTNYYNKQDVYKLIGTFAEQIVQIIVWEKKNPMPRGGGCIINSYELFIVFGDKPLLGNHTYTKNIISTSVYSKMPKEHKAVMHPDVADWFVKTFTQPNEIILDPFMGIGTTAVACLKNNRNYIGFELVFEYCQMAEQNLMEAKQNIFSALTAERT